MSWIIFSCIFISCVCRTVMRWISAFMALISPWPTSESTAARVSRASCVFFSHSMIWRLSGEREREKTVLIIILLVGESLSACGWVFYLSACGRVFHLSAGGWDWVSLLSICLWVSLSPVCLWVRFSSVCGWVSFIRLWVSLYLLVGESCIYLLVGESFICLLVGKSLSASGRVFHLSACER